jgi:hypothetical protein
MPADGLATRLVLVLGDHPFLSAVLFSICFDFAALGVKVIWKCKANNGHGD